MIMDPGYPAVLNSLAKAMHSSDSALAPIGPVDGDGREEWLGLIEGCTSGALVAVSSSL